MREASNKSELREDAHAAELLAMTQEDARLGRMSWPTPVREGHVDDCLLCPRFAVEQSKPDGSVKLRAVDNFSWAACWRGDAAAAARPSMKERKEHSVNGHVMPEEKMKHDTLDELCAVMSLFVELTGKVPGLWKADVDAAFRRVPVRADHRWACGIAFVVKGVVRRRVSAYVCLWLPYVSVVQAYSSTHASCPFGAVASVHAWERIGAALAHIARRSAAVACVATMVGMARSLGFSCCLYCGMWTIISHQTGVTVCVPQVGVHMLRAFVSGGKQ